MILRGCPEGFQMVFRRYSEMPREYSEDVQRVPIGCPEGSQRMLRGSSGDAQIDVQRVIRGCS